MRHDPTPDPGVLVGLAVATFVGNNVYGWIAAGLTVGVLGAVQKVRGTNQTCAISPSAVASHGIEEPHDAGHTDIGSR